MMPILRTGSLGRGGMRVIRGVGQHRARVALLADERTAAGIGKGGFLLQPGAGQPTAEVQEQRWVPDACQGWP